MSLHVKFEQAVDPSIVTVPPVVLVTEQFEVYEDTDIPELLKICSEQLQNRIDSYQGMGSGWTMRNLHALDTTIWKLEPLRGNTYHSLSKWIQNTKCVVNVKNMDNECFRHAVVAGLYTPLTHSSLVYSYKQFVDRDDAPDFSMLTFPVQLRDIVKFEAKNEISVNVYGVDERDCKRKAPSKTTKPKSRCEFLDDEAIESGDESSDESEDGNVSDLIDDSDQEEDISMYHRFQVDEIREEIDRICIVPSDPEPEPQETECTDNKRGFIYPLRVAKGELARHVNLLLTEKDGIPHYSTIKNFSGFLRCQYSKYHGTTYYCYSCLHGFAEKKGEKERSECKLLQEHLTY